MARKKKKSEEFDFVVELNDAIALLDSFPALSGVNLRVDEGDILHIKGPNGAGKSTLLNMCAGLQVMHSGSGQVLGNDISKSSKRRNVRRLTGLLGHETSLYDELTVYENIKFWSQANKVDLKIIEPIMERLNLNGRIKDVKVGNLSAGQKRRTSFAIIVCRRPRLWLLDEPYSGLDLEGQDLVDVLVKNAVNFGATVIFTSHDFARAKKLSTRVVELQGGRIRESSQEQKAKLKPVKNTKRPKKRKEKTSKEETSKGKSNVD